MNQALIEEIVQWTGSISISVAAIMSLILLKKRKLLSNHLYMYAMIGFACIFGLTRVYWLFTKFTDTSLSSYIWSIWLAELIVMIYMIHYHCQAFRKYNSKNKR